MNPLYLAFGIILIAVIAVSLALFWHWKTYMPESSRGATIFTIYIIGLGILFILLYGTLTGIN